MAKQDLFLEEAVLDDLAGDLSSLETPLSQKAFRLVGVITFILMALVIGRVSFLGIWRGGFYSQQAMINMGEISENPAQRGIIFDKFSEPLAKNNSSFKVSLLLVDFLKDFESRLETTDSLEDILGLPKGYIEEALKSVDLERQNSIVLARDLELEDIIKIKNLNIGSVRIEDDFSREYLGGGLFSHIVGYTGSVNSNDADENPEISLNDIIGKSGLELYYDNELRGEDGKTINYRNAVGEIIDSKLLTNASDGNQIYSTIDSGLQSFFSASLKSNISRVGSRSAVGIAVNPQNGEVLSLVSLPSFDNNEITNKDLADSAKPFFNRAISGEYAPGSTIKPLVAFAVLKEKIISPEHQIFSAGYIDIPNPYNPDKPSRFLDWKPNGWVNLFSAIAKSSNIYFYAVSGGLDEVKGLGIERLKEYWGKFGLGKETGIDLPGEKKGFLPDPESKEKSSGDIWRIGDTYNVSIGQGDLLVTPIQLINYITVIANGGRLYRPSLVKKIVDSNGKIIKEVFPEIIADYSSDIYEIELIQEGMEDTVRKSYGTANILSGLPFSAAAKTGTAQIEGNTKINALFVGYAPADNPEIAILVLVENAREGSLNAVPVAKDVLEWYYYNRILNYE